MNNLGQKILAGSLLQCKCVELVLKGSLPKKGESSLEMLKSINITQLENALALYSSRWERPGL